MKTNNKKEIIIIIRQLSIGDGCENEVLCTRRFKAQILLIYLCPWKGNT